jgi:hypothetical protein
MKNVFTTVLFTLAFAFYCSSAVADSIVASYSCELKDGKTPEELQAVNSKWLKWVRTNVNQNIESSVGSPVVGKLDHFIFVDTYPDLATWAAAQTALDSDAASELENMFDEIAECTENRLWKLEATQ